jgi:hypothetical protein
MKRNWETVRELLAKVEACTLPVDTVTLGDFPDDRAAEISYHIALLMEAGLVEGSMLQTIGPEVNDFIAARLSWEGHELIDSIRSDTVWERTKKRFRDAGVEMSIDLVKEAAQAVAKGLLT